MDINAYICKKDMLSGIYSIENLINSKKYIGFARNLKQRKKRHYTQLRGNIHVNSYLQAAWNKYGEENFKFNYLKFCEIEELAFWEDYYVKQFNTLDRNLGYNIEPTDPNNKSIISAETRSKISKAMKGRYLGRKASQETKDKMSLVRTGKKASETTKQKMSLRNHNNSPVLQLTLDEIFIQEFPNISLARKATGKGDISQCCIGKRKTANGFKWKYKNDKSIKN